MIYSCIFLLVCACLSFLYGLYILYRKKPPMYFKLIVFVMASQIFSRAFYVIELLCYGELPDTFNIGLVGFATFFLFLFFSNSGEIDSLVDDETQKITKYRIIPVIIPVIELGISVAALFREDADITIRISYVILSVLAGFAGYLNMKHLIIPDVEDGIVRSIRGFNLCCIILEILTLSEAGLYCFGLGVITSYLMIATGVMYLVLLPLLNKEVKKWII